MKRILVIAIVVAAVAAAVNDAGRYLTGVYDLGNATRDVANAAASAAKQEGRGQRAGGRVAVAEAEKRGIRVYGYQCVGNHVEVWTESELPGTWVAGPFLAIRAGEPLDTPITLRTKDRALVQ